MVERDTTRNRILATARALFNEGGVSQTSVNRIATDVGISSGNLHYHFKTKEQIALWLVRRFQERMEAIATPPAAIALDDLWLVLHLALEAVQEYRFIYRDVDFLVRQSPQIAHRLQRITARGVLGAQQMCGQLVKSGVIRASAEDVDSLAVQMMLTATCWYTFARVWPGAKNDADPAGRAAYHVLTLLTPYLTGDARLYMTYLRGKYLK